MERKAEGENQFNSMSACGQRQRLFGFLSERQAKIKRRGDKRQSLITRVNQGKLDVLLLKVFVVAGMRRGQWSSPSEVRALLVAVYILLSVMVGPPSQPLTL